MAAAASSADDVPSIVVPKLISRNRTVDDDAKHRTLKKGSLTNADGSKSPGAGPRSSSSSPAGTTPPMAASPTPPHSARASGSGGMPALSLNSGEPVPAGQQQQQQQAAALTNGAANNTNATHNNGNTGAVVPASSSWSSPTNADGTPATVLTTELHPDQPVMDIAEGPIFSETELDMGRKWKWTLSFPVPALEQYYLLFYRGRALFLARLAFAVVLIVNTIAAYTDTFVYDSSDLPTIYAIRYAGIEPLCLGIGLFTLNPRWEPYRQRVTAFWVLAVGALLISISYVSGTPDHGVYMVYFFAVYLFVGLRFLYTAGMCWLLFIMFNVVNYVCTYDRLGERRTWVESFGYLFLTNLMLMVTGYILESSTRSAFLKLQKLRLEQTRTNKILRNILPEEMVENLLEGKLTADYYQLASVLFCDIYDFKAISSDLPAHELVGMMNHIFSRFDAIIDRYQAIKIETIGEVYMAASGLPQVADWHAENLCYLALDMQQALSGFRAPPVRARAKSGQETVAGLLSAPPKQNDDVKVPHGASDDEKDKLLGKRIQLRIGINSGKTIAGVIGLKLPRYRLFGDTVNTASRMQSTCLPEKIQISEIVYDQVKECMRCTYRGTIPVKGKGEMKTWFIDGAAHPQDPAHNVNFNVKTQGAAANMFSELMRAGEARARDIYDDDPEEAALVADAARRESLLLSAAAASAAYPSSAPAALSPLGGGASLGAALASGVVQSQADSLVAAAAGAWARRPEDGAQLIKRRNSQGRLHAAGQADGAAPAAGGGGSDYNLSAFGVPESPRARGASRAVTASAMHRGQSFAGQRGGGGGGAGVGGGGGSGPRASVSSAAGPNRFHAHMRSASVSRIPPGLGGMSGTTPSMSSRALKGVDDKQHTTPARAESPAPIAEGKYDAAAAATAAAKPAPVAVPASPAPGAAPAPVTPAHDPAQALIDSSVAGSSTPAAAPGASASAVVIELPTLNSAAPVVPAHPPTRSEPHDTSEA